MNTTFFVVWFNHVGPRTRRISSASTTVYGNGGANMEEYPRKNGSTLRRRNLTFSHGSWFVNREFAEGFFAETPVSDTRNFWGGGLKTVLMT